MRRILLVNWRDIRHPGAGGAEVHLWKVFGGTAKGNHEVHMICAGFPGALAEEYVEGIVVHRVGRDITFPFCLPFALKKLCKNWPPDVIVEAMNKVPLLVAAWSGHPTMGVVHHLFGSVANTEVPALAAWSIRFAEKAIPLAYKGRTILTGSASSRSELIGLGMNTNNVHLFPYGTDVDGFYLGEKSPDPRLLYLGRLKRYKGVDHLVAIAAKLREKIPNLKVDVVGEGDARPGLDRLIRAQGLGDCITLHGQVDSIQRLKFLQEAWLMVFPSLKEGFGLTVPEAALCGTPTVGYDVPGLQDSIESGKSGALVPYGDVEGLASVVENLLTDNELRHTMAMCARERYADFSWSAAANATWKLINAAADVPVCLSAQVSNATR